MICASNSTLRIDAGRASRPAPPAGLQGDRPRRTAPPATDGEGDRTGSAGRGWTRALFLRQSQRHSSKRRHEDPPTRFRRHDGASMTEELAPGITGLLRNWSDGDSDALWQLLPLVIADLRHMARARMRGESSGHLLQPTALVNEFILRASGTSNVSWECRGDFFSFAATTMRRILVDDARRRNRLKRGGGNAAVLLEAETPQPASAKARVDVLVVNEALERLEKHDRRNAEVVKFRYFLGMTVEETAAALGVSKATVKRDWQFARLWLARELEGGASVGEG